MLSSWTQCLTSLVAESDLASKHSSVAMPCQAVGPDWKMVTLIWGDDIAKGFLAQPPPDGVPIRGPLRLLLTRTNDALHMLVPESFVKDPRASRQAVEGDAIAALTRIMHWLQQRPCQAFQVDVEGLAYWGNCVVALNTVIYSVSKNPSTSLLPSDKRLCIFVWSSSCRHQVGS